MSALRADAAGKSVRQRPQRELCRDAETPLQVQGGVRPGRARCSQRTTCERAHRPRAHPCFALAEQSSEDAAPAQLVVVRSEHVVGGEAGTARAGEAGVASSYPR